MKLLVRINHESTSSNNMANLCIFDNFSRQQMAQRDSEKIVLGQQVQFEQAGGT